MRVSTPRGRSSEGFRRIIAELYMSDSSKTTRALAEEYGCHHSTIWRILKEKIPKDILTQRRRGAGLQVYVRIDYWSVNEWSYGFLRTSFFRRGADQSTTQHI